MSKPPIKVTKARLDAYLDGLRSGLRRADAALKVNLEPSTIRKHVKRNKPFRAKRDEAEMQAHERIEDRLFKKALDGHVASMIFYLCNRLPARWQHVNKIEVTGGDGGAIAFEDLVKAVGKDRKIHVDRLGLLGPSNGNPLKGKGNGVEIPSNGGITAREE